MYGPDSLFTVDRDMDLEMQYDRIYRYCYFKLHSREAAEDITQETFLRFLGSGSYQSMGKALRYLYTIARNLCIDEARKQIRRGESKAGTDAEGQDMDSYEAECQEGGGMEERLVTVLAIREALLELEEEERELILLRYVNEVPVDVIGKIYGISRFSVYRRTKEALKCLREKLGEEDFV